MERTARITAQIQMEREIEQTMGRGIHIFGVNLPPNVNVPIDDKREFATPEANLKWDRLVLNTQAAHHRRCPC